MKYLLLLLASLSAGIASSAQSYTTFTGKDSMMGLKDPQGKIIVSAEYDYVCPFFLGGVSYVRRGELFGLIDKTGKPLSPVRYNEVNPSEEGFVYVNTGGQWSEDEEGVTGGKWGLLDAAGKTIVPVQYDQIGEYHKEGYLLAITDHKWGVLGKTGRELTPFRYDYIRSSNTTPGIAMVNIGGVYDDVFGDPEFNETTGGQQGFINCLSGKELGPLAYAHVEDFSEGLAATAIQKDKTGPAKWRYGYINTSGAVVIAHKYEQAGPFRNGKAQVTLEGRKITIDKTGKEIK